MVSLFSKKSFFPSVLNMRKTSLGSSFKRTELHLTDITFNNGISISGVSKSFSGLVIPPTSALSGSLGHSLSDAQLIMGLEQEEASYESGGEKNGRGCLSEGYGSGLNEY